MSDIDVDGEPPEFDLAPQDPIKDTAKGQGVNRRRWMAIGVLVVIAVAAGFLVTKALGSATDYFYQVDEAVAHRGDLGTRRFRIQGSVANSPQSVTLRNNQQRIDFSLSANGITVPVTYTGSDPPALFRKCEPVVIVGNWESKADNARFVGTQIIIKHTESYTAEHKDRMTAPTSCEAGVTK